VEGGFGDWQIFLVRLEKKVEAVDVFGWRFWAPMHASSTALPVAGSHSPSIVPGPIRQNGMTGGATRRPDLCIKQPGSRRGLTDSQ
jgi:hypothetical protein